MAHEFDLIRDYFQPLSRVAMDEVGIGDDGAVLNCPPQSQLVVVTDTLVEGVHFPMEALPGDIGWKALAVNLSDLAAMGATPAFFSLALSLPERCNHAAWLNAFAAGLATLAEGYQLPLIGGDTTRSDRLTVTVTAQGWVREGRAVLRQTARPGDKLYVTGTLGDGALGLQAWQNQWDSEAYAVSLAKLNRPEPRVEVGALLGTYASSAIDVSDGLLADVTHLIEASGVGAALDMTAIPLSAAMQQQIDDTPQAWSMPLSGGDDYELCFTLPPERIAAFEQACRPLAIPIRPIGCITAGQTLVLNNRPENLTLHSLGYQHF
ncbi:MAG: thiamine-phosphate kinase [Hydrogenovibrio sp.]